MKIIFIKCNLNDVCKVFKSYSKDGEFLDSYFFRGSGEKTNTLFYVTHGSPDGYLVLNGNKEEATYSKKEFAFYINGLFEFSNMAETINEIITIECFGGYHVPIKLDLRGKEVLMKPLGDQKAELWAGWRNINKEYYFCVMIASRKELSDIANNISGFISISPKHDENVRKIEAISYFNQKKFVSNLFDKIIKSETDIGDYFIKEIDYEKI